MKIFNEEADNNNRQHTWSMDNKTFKIYIKSWKQTFNKDHFCVNILLNNFPLFVPFGDKSFLEHFKDGNNGNFFVHKIYSFLLLLPRNKRKQTNLRMKLNALKMLPLKYFGALSLPSITLKFWQQFSLEAWPTYHYSTEVTHSIVITHWWLSQNSNKLVNGVKICTGNTNRH